MPMVYLRYPRRAPSSLFLERRKGGNKRKDGGRLDLRDVQLDGQDSVCPGHLRGGCRGDKKGPSCESTGSQRRCAQRMRSWHQGRAAHERGPRRVYPCGPCAPPF